MRPYATIRVAIIVLFLGWVLLQLGSGVVRLLEPPQRVRSPDTVAIPAHELNPRPQLGTLPAPTPLTEAQAMETLLTMRTAPLRSSPRIKSGGRRKKTMSQTRPLSQTGS